MPTSKSEFEFYSPVNTVKVLLSQSVNLLTFFLGSLVLWALSALLLKQYLCNTFASN